MLRTMDFQALGAWCQAHDMTWSASQCGGADLTVTLEPEGWSRHGQRMRLVVNEPGLRLEDARGEAVACASDLPALLDAMDSGVADFTLGAWN